MHFLHITVIGVNVFCSLEISTKKRAQKDLIIFYLLHG